MKKNSLKKQQGTTMFLLLVFFVGMFAFVGMATDSGHLWVNKDRLQNAMDAAALSAAITLNNDITRNTANATTAGKNTFDLFKSRDGNVELSDINRDDLTFEYSKHLIDPVTGTWNPGTTPAAFVRVSTNAHDVEPIYIQVLSAFRNPVNVYAVSTAGAMGQTCEVTPFVLCAKMAEPFDPDKGDDYCLDPDTPADDPYCQPYDPLCDLGDGDGIEDAGNGVGECFGYDIGGIQSLVVACNGSTNGGCSDTEVEAGNYNLLDLDTLQGGRDIKEAIEAGTVDTDDFNACASSTLNTKPGYTWGNVRAGINNRFDQDTNTTEYCTTTTTSGATCYPSKTWTVAPDTTTPAPSSLYSSKNYRREMSTLLGDCRGLQNGNSNLPKVGNACVLLTQYAYADGSEKKIMAEFLKTCHQDGNASPINAAINGPFKIVLFKSAGGRDS